MKTLLDPRCRERLLLRLRGLAPDTPPRWGRMSAPQMLAHLCDSLRHHLGEVEVRSRPGVLRWPIVKPLMMYWIPWPKGRIRGPRALFQTPPGTWQADLARFEALLSRFAAETGRTGWPDHPLFGRMTYRSWGRFGHRHFDHHLRQFGV